MFIEDKKILPKDFPFEIAKYQETKTQNSLSIAHKHSFFEVTYVLDGWAEYFVNGLRYVVSSGDLILFNDVEEHRWNVLSDEIVLEVLVFSSELITNGIPMFDAEYLLPFLNRGGKFRK